MNASMVLTQEIRPMIMEDNGSDTIHTRANFQPFTRAKIIPTTNVDSKYIKVPTFSPIPSSILERLLKKMSANQ